MNFSQLNNFYNFSLNDLIVELDLFFSDGLIKEIEWKINESKLKDWKIDVSLIKGNLRNRASTYLIYEAENKIMDDSSKLTEKELEYLE